MQFMWILILSVLAMLCFERIETASCKDTCIRSSKKVNKLRERCGWWWQQWCTKQSKYYIGHDFYTCYKQCPIHGKWSQWANWSSWTKCAPSHYDKCIGEEVKKRIRHCNNPTPQHKGNNCYGSGIQTYSKECPLKNSVKNGGWSTWGQWITLTPCSKLCGKGSKIVVRHRSCSNPAPRCGGKICHGDSVESQTMDCYIKKSCGSKVLANLKKAHTKKSKSKIN